MNATSDNSTLRATEIEPIKRSIPSLPIEVHEHIINSLDGLHPSDRKTILCCALVCRAWLPFSKCKLFQAIPLASHEEWVLFKQILFDPPPYIVSYLETTRALKVSAPLAYLYKDEIGFGTGQEQPWEHFVMAYCARCLSGLTCIFFDDIDWSQWWVCNTAFAACCRFKALTQLNLYNCIFTNRGQLELLVYAFPSLQDLTLDSLMFTDFQPTPRCYRKGPQLKLLHLDCLSSDSLILAQWLVDSCSTQTLSDLVLLGRDMIMSREAVS